MPATPWGEINGELCVVCSAPASHFYFGAPLCCQCHGGNICTQEETEERNVLGTWRARIATELLGWKRVILDYNKIVDDDGCLSGNRCSMCDAKYGKEHKPSCQHMNYSAVWQKDNEVYSDTGNPKHYVYVQSWHPYKNAEHAIEILYAIANRWGYSWAVFYDHNIPLCTAAVYDKAGDKVDSAQRVQPQVAVCELAVKLLDREAGS